MTAFGPPGSPAHELQPPVRPPCPFPYACGPGAQAGCSQFALEAGFKQLTGEPLQGVQYGKPHAVTYDYAAELMARHTGQERDKKPETCENFLDFRFQLLPLPSQNLNGSECLQYSN